MAGANRFLQDGRIKEAIMQTGRYITTDEKMESIIEELKKGYGKSDVGELLKLGIGLLKIANDGRSKDQRLVLADKNNNIISEIVTHKG
jgi:hypothetical protein